MGLVYGGDEHGMGMGMGFRRRNEIFKCVIVSVVHCLLCVLFCRLQIKLLFPVGFMY